MADTDDRIEAYAEGLLRIAQSEGRMRDVEDELFRFARTVEGNDDLGMALSDSSLPVERRVALVEDILGAKALQMTTAIVSFIVASGRGRDLPAIVDRFVAAVAASRDYAVAEVRSAIPLDDAQKDRLAAALGQATGKQVEVKVVIDESVLGGLVATIGETVIDGSIRHRLDKFKESL